MIFMFYFTTQANVAVLIFFHIYVHIKRSRKVVGFIAKSDWD